MADTQPYVRPDVKAVLDALAAMAGPEMSEIPLADARASYLAMGAMLEADPLPLVKLGELNSKALMLMDQAGWK